MYHPIRDWRFEYVTEAIDNIEQNSCSLGCQRGSPGAEYPSLGCSIVENVMLENDVEEIDDRGEEGLHCTVREPVLTEVEKLQLPLW